jgi:hypothetical protein
MNSAVPVTAAHWINRSTCDLSHVCHDMTVLYFHTVLRKPYLSSVCRQLGVKTPGVHLPRRESPSPVAEQSLAAIRGILAARKASMVASPVVSR